MSTSEDLRELSRQSRIRLAAVGQTRAEHQIIRAQSARRLVESRELLDRAADRWPQGPPGRTTADPAAGRRVGV